MAKVLRCLLPRSVRRLCVLAATTALLAVACLPAPSSAAVEWVVRQVQLLHRHGSRSADVPYNRTEICATTPCGYLNPEGETMMVNVGSFLRTRYTTDATVVDEPFLTSPDYDLDVVSSRSTDVLRTLQSANRLLAGLFPTQTRLIPAIHTVRATEDVLLMTYDVPAWISLYFYYATDAQNRRMNPVVDFYFPNFADLTAVGAALFSEGYCSDVANRWPCAAMLWDIAAAWRSTGELPALVEEHYMALREIMAEFYRYVWYYNPDDEFVVQQGGRGQPFLEQVLANIDGFLAGTNTFKVMHYSAHDTTVGPVWGTLGDNSTDGILPLFSQLFLLELVQSATDSTYGVRVLRGWPGQTPDTGFAFTLDSTWQLQCRDSTGAAYAATDNVCPLEDFRRYVQSTAGTSPLGMCLLDADTQAVLNCPTPAEDLAGNVTLSASCAEYRANCAAFACADGYVLDAATSRCVCASSSCLATTPTTAAPVPVPVPVTVQMSGVSGGAAAGIAIATFAVGAILAAAVTALIATLLRRSSTANRPLTPGQKNSDDYRPANAHDMA